MPWKNSAPLWPLGPVETRRPADVGGAGHPGDERDQRRRDGLQPGRQGLELLGRQRLLGDGVLDVDQRARPGDRDRLLDPAHRQLGVDVGGESRRQHDAFPDDRREARQGEGDGVVSRYQVDGVVVALAVREDGAGPLDQRRAGDFYRYAGQQAARVVGHRAGDARGLLRRGGDGHDEHRGDERRPDAPGVVRTGSSRRDRRAVTGERGRGARPGHVQGAATSHRYASLPVYGRDNGRCERRPREGGRIPCDAGSVQIGGRIPSGAGSGKRSLANEEAMHLPGNSLSGYGLDDDRRLPDGARASRVYLTVLALPRWTNAARDPFTTWRHATARRGSVSR